MTAPAWSHVKWQELEDSTGSAAAVPALLTDLESEDPEVAQEALRRLRGRICQYGFVVYEATAVTVPFLWDVVQKPHITCRAEILRLLRSIAVARQWQDMATLYPRLLHRGDFVGWERQAHRAVRARHHSLRRLTEESDPELAAAADDLATTLAA